MKISENRRLRGEKKALARHDHQARMMSGAEKKFFQLASAIADGPEAAAKLDLSKTDLILKKAGKTTADLQELVEELRAESA